MDPTDIPALNDWLRRQCTPGRIAVQRVIIEEDLLLAHLPALLRAQSAADRSVLVFMDHTPMRRANRDAKSEFLQIVASICQPEVIYLGTAAEPPHADLELAEKLASRLPRRALLVSFGSGTVTDLTKHARFLADRAAPQQDHRTFVSVPTACTVTAFSSALAVLGVSGVKRTIPSQSPDEVWIDLPLLAAAPMELTRAGAGDLLARGVAYADWYLSSLLGIDESYSDVPRRLLADHESRLPEIASALAGQDRTAFRALMEALLLAGYAMSVAGQTTPISGWEHVMSHYLDLSNGALGRPLNLHGLQVAAGTFVATRVYLSFLRNVIVEELLAAADVDLASLARPQIDRHFAPIDPSGAIRAEILRDYLPKADRWRAAAPRLRALAREWPTHVIRDEILSRLMPLDEMDLIAEVLDLPRSLTALDSLPSASTPLDAVGHAHLVRSRFTLGDMLSALHWLDDGRINRWLCS